MAMRATEPAFRWGRPAGGTAVGALRLGIVALALAACASALACRYNLRDLAFADLEPQPFRLFLFVRNHTPADLSAAAEREATVRFRDANVQCKTVNLDADPPSGARALVAAHSLTTFPALVLVSPDQRSLALTNEGQPTPQSLAGRLEAVVASPLRAKLQARLVEAYAAVLLVEGPDPTRNQEVREAAAAAVRQVQDIMARLPKAIKGLPEIETLTPAQARAERVALWSLGVDENDLTEPLAVVVHGRGKRIGPVLRGKDLRHATLYHVLSVVGQDCECYLDRSWMRGPSLPQRWDAAQQKRAVDQLGFDAENPLVKAEMNAILARGPNPNAKPVGLIGGTDAELIGYQEVRLDPAPTEPPPASTNLPAPPAPLSPTTNTLTPAKSDDGSATGVSWSLAALAVLALGGGLGVWLMRGRNLP